MQDEFSGDRDTCRGQGLAQRRPNPQWLLSIRGPAEWPIAIRSGAHVIDFKEPRQGPLAPVDPDIWRWAADQPDCPALLSAALGEPSDALEIAGKVPAEFHFAKMGPSGCDTREKLVENWSRVRECLDGEVELVAVAYADDAGCVDVESVIAAAHTFGIERVLVDTFGKDGQSSIDHLGTDRLNRIGRQVAELGMWWALAGSIKLAAIDRLAAEGIFPDCFGVRGDVCGGGREGSIETERVSRWNQAIKKRPDLQNASQL